MKKIESLHLEAMSYAEIAALAQATGDIKAALENWHTAFTLECKAADLVSDRHDLEPTRGILHRSAATLAIDCGELRAAEKLAARGLVGEPPEVIAEELRDVFDQAMFHRHLEVHGVELVQREMQMSLSGPGVGKGLAKGKDFISRISNLEKILFRTAERTLRQPFRTSGRRSTETCELVDLYLSTARPSSYAVTVRLGRTQQLGFPEVDLAEVVLDEVLDCFELMERNSDDLGSRIDDPAYLRNFIGLAKLIAPDGDNLTRVGFTKGNGEETRVVTLTSRTARVEFLPTQDEDDEGGEVIVEGLLKYADSLKKQSEIRIVGENGEQHKIIVPEGMMDDIVRPLWDVEVRVSGRKRADKLMLTDIRPI